MKGSALKSNSANLPKIWNLCLGSVVNSRVHANRSTKKTRKMATWFK